MPKRDRDTELCLSLQMTSKSWPRRKHTQCDCCVDTSEYNLQRVPLKQLDLTQMKIEPNLELTLGQFSSCTAAVAVSIKENSSSFDTKEAFKETFRPALKVICNMLSNLDDIPRQAGKLEKETNHIPEARNAGCHSELCHSPIKLGGTQEPSLPTAELLTNATSEGNEADSQLRIQANSECTKNSMTLSKRTHLLELLLACARAMICRAFSQVEYLLQQAQPLVSSFGDSFQRVAFYLVQGLRARLESMNSVSMQVVEALQQGMKLVSNKQKQEAYEMMYKVCPFVPFAHFACNSMIMEAIEGEESVHIVDIGMESSLQWQALLQSLSYRSGKLPRLVRITGIGTSREKIKEAGELLQHAANALKLPLFMFRGVTVQTFESLDCRILNIREEEALIVNSVFYFHRLVKESRDALDSLLRTIHILSPKLVTVVEQHAAHNGPFFYNRFQEALQYYTTVFDSLEATMPRNNSTRVKIESFHFGEEIKNIIACEGTARVERHERMDQWRRRMGRRGFKPFPLGSLKFKASLWLANLYPRQGFTLVEEKQSLFLGWGGKPIMAASCWCLKER